MDPLRNAIMNYKVVCAVVCCLVPSWYSLSISSKVVCDNQDVMVSAFRLLKVRKCMQTSSNGNCVEMLTNGAL